MLIELNGISFVLTNCARTLVPTVVSFVRCPSVDGFATASSLTTVRTFSDRAAISPACAFACSVGTSPVSSTLRSKLLMLM